MEALVERLSRLDSRVGGALRVVTFYDTLLGRRVDLPALVRASAGLAECVVGVRLHGDGRTMRVSPDGRPGQVPLPPASTTVPITLDGEEIGTTWLERPGPPRPLDQLLLDRLALTAAAVVERYGPASTTMSDPALVELAVGADSDEAARARALRLLGFAADVPLRAVAIRSHLPLDQVARPVTAGRPVKAAPLADAGVLLATTIDPARFPAGVRAGIGPADRPDRSWEHARTALRFTTARQPVVEHQTLGALALLAFVPPDAVRGNPDLVALARVAATPDDLETLAAYCDTGSLRRAADRLHLHHTSVARRLDQIEEVLGFALAGPAGLTRARLALTARGLLDG